MKSLRYWKESKQRKTAPLEPPPSCNPSLLMMNYPVGRRENIEKNKQHPLCPLDIRKFSSLRDKFHEPEPQY
jgi:hypothetical protein